MRKIGHQVFDKPPKALTGNQVFGVDDISRGRLGDLNAKKCCDSTDHNDQYGNPNKKPERMGQFVPDDLHPAQHAPGRFHFLVFFFLLVGVFFRVFRYDQKANYSKRTQKK